MFIRLCEFNEQVKEEGLSHFGEKGTDLFSISYIEMNPVLTGMCEEPADYKWSSCSTKLARGRFAWLDFDPLYTGLGETQQERAEKYETFLAGTITEEEKQILLGAVQRGQLT